MTDPRIAAVADALEAHYASGYTCRCGREVNSVAGHMGGAAVAALDAYDDAHPLEALAAYRERVERDVRAAVAAEIEAERRIARDAYAPDEWLDALRRAARIARGDT